MNDIDVVPIYGIEKKTIKGKLQEIIKREKPDLIHYHYTVRKLREVTQVAGNLRTPLVVTVHGIENLAPMYEYEVKSSTDQPDLIPFLRKSAHTVAVSRDISDYCRMYGLNNVSVIHGGVDINFYHPMNGSPRRGILYVGRANRYKGLREVCEGFLQIENKIQDDLCLVGRGITRKVFDHNGFFLDGPDRKRLEELIESGRVKLIGELPPERLRRLYQKVRALTLPSLTEGFPLVVLEALACGTPAVVTRVGSVSDVIADGCNGFLIQEPDSNELARSLLRLPELEGPDLPARCRESVTPFSTDRMVEKYMKVFQEACCNEGVSGSMLQKGSICFE